MKYVPAESESSQMKCPHCTTSVHESWNVNVVYTRDEKGNQTGTHWRLQYMLCPECHKSIMRLGSMTRQGPNFPLQDPASWIQIFPTGSTRALAPKEVPTDIANDHAEAAKVLALSPKASAALSRRCLQAVLLIAGYTQKDLAKQIDAVLAEPDGKKTLPSGLQMIVDAVRNLGNFAAHKITDQTTLQIIDVDPAEAEYCLDVLDAVFDHYYVKPAQAQAIKDALNAKLAAANKPPIK
jgi:Domain of unknown function (DUF4145)